MSEGLIVWQNKYEKYDLIINSTPLVSPEISQSISSITGVPFIEEKGIDASEIIFGKKLKKAEKQDYVFAVFCGLASALFDQYVVGTSPLPLKEMDKEAVLKTLTETALRNYGFTGKVIDSFLPKYEKALKDVIEGGEQIAQLAVDFRNTLSFSGLLFSVLSKVTGYGIGKNADGDLSFALDSDRDLLKGMSIWQKIVAGVASWFVDSAIAYRDSGAFNEGTMRELLRFKQGFTFLRKCIVSVSESPLFDKNQDRNKLHDWAVRTAAEINGGEELEAIQKALSKQSLSVLFNKCLVRTYQYLRVFVREIKERKVKSVEGLPLIRLNFSENDFKILARIDTVSTAVFTAVDGVDALAAAYLSYKAGDKTGAIASFISRINLANVFELVSVVKVDTEYIKEDLRDHKKAAAVKQSRMLEKEKKLNRELLARYWGLNKIEERILYSLELDLVEKDIAETKDSETQIRKNRWKEEWMRLSSEGSENKKLFERDPEKTYALLMNRASNDGVPYWLYATALELLLFEPYTPLIDQTNKGKNNKQYAGLKLEKKDYVQNDFCGKQSAITVEDVKILEKTYKTEVDYLKGKGRNVGVIVPVGIAAVAALAAFIFAPNIAVLLAGGAFTGLHGAALTSASLAYFGGGAIAAGGLGMAGGTAVIAGGGGLLGLSTSGAVFATMAMLTSATYTMTEYAKLLTICKAVLLDKEHKTDDVRSICVTVEESIRDIENQIFLLKDTINNQKLSPKSKKMMTESIKEQEKSLEIIRRASERLNTFCE